MKRLRRHAGRSSMACGRPCDHAQRQRRGFRAGRLSEPAGHIVVPFSAGSITDILARILADKLSEHVEAAGDRREPARAARHDHGREGARRRLHADADLQRPYHRGVINKGLQFDPVKDFAGVTQIASVPLVLIVPPGLAGQDAEGIHRDGEGEAGAAEFLFRRRRQHVVSLGRDLRQNAKSTWSMCPTRARRRP